MALADTLALLKTARNKYSRNLGKTVQLKEGKTKVRIFEIPGQEQFWRDAGQMWIKADEKGKPLAVAGALAVAYNNEDGTPMACEVADAVEAAIAGAMNDDELKLYKSWRARKFVLVGAKIYDGADAGPEPQILQLTPNTFADFLSIMETYAEAGVNVLDLEEGIDMVFERRGKGLDTEYTVMAAPKSEKQKKEMLAKLPDLDGFIQKEYFRPGDDRKALVAIGTVTGKPYSSGLALAGPAPTGRPSGTLTGPAAKLAGLAAPAPELEPEVEKPVAPKVEPKIEDAEIIELPEEDDEEAAAMKALEAARAAKRAKAEKAAAEAEAAKAGVKAAAAAAAIETASVAAIDKTEGFGAPLDLDDLAATLAELEGI